MSCSAYAVVGLKILNEDSICKNVVKRICECTLSGNGKFCAECGEPLKNECRENLLINYEDDEEIKVRISGFKHGAELSLHNIYCYDGNSLVFGVSVGSSDFLQNSQIGTVEKAIKKHLDKMNLSHLWKDELFGVTAELSC